MPEHLNNNKPRNEVTDPLRTVISASFWLAILADFLAPVLGVEMCLHELIPSARKLS